MGFLLNYTHARIHGSLSNISLPISPGYYVSASTDTWPNGYNSSEEVDELTGTFDLYLCDGNWTFYPPSIPGYNTPSSQNLIISEIPDTLRTIDFSYPLDVGDDQAPDALPKNYTLEQNYPNPFNQSTELRYYIPERVKSSSVSLKIYNLLGQWIKTMVNERQTPGEHSVIWYGEDENGREVSSGIYFYRLEAGDFKLTRRMVLLK